MVVMVVVVKVEEMQVREQQGILCVVLVLDGDNVGGERRTRVIGRKALAVC